MGVRPQPWYLVAARQEARRLWCRRRRPQGTSVALSADGNTALIGGPNDNPWDRSVPFGLGPAGAAWVFTRTDCIWSQQGEKLVSTGAARQGISVALSADGNVAIAGGLASDGGAAHRCLPAAAGSGRKARRSSAAGAVGKSSPSVALSADGSGGSNDNGGAAWTFAQRAGHWIQEQKLVGSGEARKATSFIATSSEDGVMGRANEERIGPAAPSWEFSRLADHSQIQNPLAAQTEAPAISTRPGLPMYRAMIVGGRSQRGPPL